jgi:glutathione synthase/RimK-type ligase-like ATP-grasp enzyme
MTKVVVITPINRYLGFSAPISPVEQFKKAAKEIPGVDVVFLDPQRSHIETIGKSISLINSDGEQVLGDVYFAFGHDLLDRNMTRYIIRALEQNGELVINGYDALTILDDKALMAIEFAKSDIPVARSTIVSARSNSTKVIEFIGGNKIIAKTSGFSAGGVGVEPLPSDINYVAPSLWSSRMDNKPKILQNDLYKNDNDARSVIRTYIVGNKIIGSYSTKGYGIVNCAGLARESHAESIKLANDQAEILLSAAKLVKSTGYCRIDSVGEKENFAIIEINPLARIDAEDYDLDIPSAILKFAKKLHKRGVI